MSRKKNKKHYVAPKNESSLEDVIYREQLIAIEKQNVLTKALGGTDVNEIFKAQNYLKAIEQKEETNPKSYFIDPLDLSHSFGYKTKPFSLSYDMLRGMSRLHVVKSVIETRKDQVISFCTPQTNKYETGFIIEKKPKFSLRQEEQKLSKKDEEVIEGIIEFILNCGSIDKFWHGDDFATFTSKFLSDSLTFDQGTFECIRNRKGDLVEFLATDASTFRLADSYEDDERYTRQEEILHGYAPSYVQLYLQQIKNEFYPWELCFGVRNPSTDIRTSGYGRSELEDMIQTVTALLQSDTYNSNFFKVGSAPKGILKYSGNINTSSLDEFRKQWISQVSGVANAHKLPIINADKMDFINLQQNNKDMEFSKYQEFLIKVTCAMYKMDPSEIGFPMQGSSDAKPMFEGNNEARLKYSRDKGLKPLLKKYEAWINKYLISQINPEFRFRFSGIDDISSLKDDLDQDIQRLSNFMTVDEIRAKWSMKDMPDGFGKIILNPTYYQQIAAKQMQEQGMGSSFDDEGDDEGQSNDADNPFTNPGGGGQDQQEGGDDNPFLKSLEKELPYIFN